MLQSSHEDSIGIMLAAHQIRVSGTRLVQTTLSWGKSGVSKPPKTKFTVEPIADMGTLNAKLSPNVIKDVLDTVVKPLEPEITASLLTLFARYSSVLAMDHTFKSASKQCTDIYSACLTMRSNVSGALLTWLTESTATVDMTDMVQLVVKLSTAIQRAQLEKVLEKVTPAAVELQSCSADEQFALSYLAQSYIVSIKKGPRGLMVKRLRQPTHEELAELASDPLDTIFVDNCCHVRTAMLNACPHLLLQLPVKERAEHVKLIEPVSSDGFQLSPLRLACEHIATPAPSPLFHLKASSYKIPSQHSPEAIAQSNLDALLGCQSLCFDLEWEPGSADGLAAIILAGTVTSGTQRTDVAITVNVFGALPRHFADNPLLAKIKAVFADPSCTKYGFSIGNDKARLHGLDFKLENLVDLATHPAVKALPVKDKRRTLAYRAQAVLDKQYADNVLQAPIAVSKGGESTTFTSSRFSPAQWRYCHYDGFLTHVVASLVDDNLKLNSVALERRRIAIALKYDIDSSLLYPSVNSAGDQGVPGSNNLPAVALNVDKSAGVKGDLYHGVRML
jgi:hypothetical protein